MDFSFYVQCYRKKACNVFRHVWSCPLCTQTLARFIERWKDMACQSKLTDHEHKTNAVRPRPRDLGAAQADGLHQRGALQNDGDRLRTPSSETSVLSK